MGKVQHKAQSSHILKLRERCWLLKYITVQFRISPDVQNSETPMFSVRILYHLKASHRHACGRWSEGLSHLSLSYEENHAEKIFHSIYKNISKNLNIRLFPLIPAMICITMVGFSVLTRFILNQTSSVINTPGKNSACSKASDRGVWYFTEIV